MAAKYSLPTATNARNLVSTPLDRVTTAASKTAEEPKVKDTLTLELPKDTATLRLENSNFLDELSQMNRPIDRMQNLTSSCTQKLQRAVNTMNPISEYARSISTKIDQNIQRAIRISTNIASSSVVRQIDANVSARMSSGRLTRSFAPSGTTFTDKMMSVPSTLNKIQDNAVSTVKNAVMSSCNSAVSFASSAINMVGSVVNFFMSLVGGLCASAFQMERTCLTKMDTRAPEVIQVAEKTLNGMASIKPSTQIEWPVKKVAEELKSLIGLVSKFNGSAGSSGGSALSGLVSLGNQCTGMLNTCMSTVRQVEALFGQGASYGLSAYQKICSLSNIGDIGNVGNYLKNNFQQLASPVTVTITMPKINSAGFTGAINRGDGLVNLGSNQQSTSANIVDPIVASGRVGNITGISGNPVINNSGSSGNWGTGTGGSSSGNTGGNTGGTGSGSGSTGGSGTGSGGNTGTGSGTITGGSGSSGGNTGGTGSGTGGSSGETGSGSGTVTGGSGSSGSTDNENSSISKATVNNGTITNATITAGVITLPKGSSISGGTLVDPNGQVLNKTVWGNISSGNIGDIGSTNTAIGTTDSSVSASVPYTAPTVKDLYGGEILGGKLENAVVSITGLEEEPVNLTGCTISIKNPASSDIGSGNDGDDDNPSLPQLKNGSTTIIDENNNSVVVTPTEIIYNGVITPATPDIKITLVSGNITEIYVTDISISAANNGDCGSRVITGVETQEINSNPIQHTVQQMVQTNRQGLVLETVMNGDDSKKSADTAKDEIINAALEETLNPELQYLVDTLVDDGYSSINDIKDVVSELVTEIEIQYKDTLDTLETKEPDPFANVIKNILDQTEELGSLLDTISDDLHDIEQNLVNDTNKTITNNMNMLLNSIDTVKDEIDDNIDDQLKDVDIIFKALDREAQLIDQIQPNVSDKTKDDSCTVEYRTYI